MYNPLNADTTKMTDVEFEKHVQNLLKEMSKKEKLNCSIEHNKKIKTDDGLYQIDVLVEYTAFGGKNLMLVECKKYSSPVKREKVELLYSRLRSIGAQKGMLFSTSRFQSGAIEFAQKHGIALIHVIEGKLIYETRSRDNKKINFDVWTDTPKYSFNHIYAVEKGIGITSINESNFESIQKFLLS